jgi:hypothetical protein
MACALGLAALTGWPDAALGQGLTGQIGGTVIDSSNAAVPGATVTVRNTATQVTREAVSDGTGAFVVTNLLAGTYDLRVTLTGFRTYEQRGINLSATERIALPPVRLEVGGFEETLTVQAEALRVQTQSAERSGTVTAEQMDAIQVKGRDFLGTLKVLPGIVDTSNREVPGWGGLGLNVNGRTSLNLTFDGITTKDTGGNFGTYAMPNMDSVAELRVQISNFQAEYGRSSGANINVITKSGSANFRGGAGYYKRHEAMNSNTWGRRRDCASGTTASCDKLPYRYDTFTYNVGGPVLIPGFNENRDKLFFFWSHEILPRTVPPNGPTRRRMPTLAERNGDFSQTVNNRGNRLWVRDPRAAGSCNVNSGGPGCFPGNVIPADRIHPLTRALFNLLPEPNIEPNEDNGFNNHEFYNTQESFRRDSILRVDWNVRPDTTFYSRIQFGRQVSESMNNQLGSNAGWPQARTEYAINTFGMVNTLLHTFNAATVLELTFGWNHGFQDVNFVDGYEARNIRDNVGLSGLPSFYPEANRERYLPDVSFSGGGMPGSAPSFALDTRFPFDARNTLWNWSANLTRVQGSHNMKVGIFIERTARPAPRAAEWNGTLSFNHNTQHALNTNLGMTNALLGIVNSYGESTKRPFAEGRFNQVEWFAQDNWRIARALTVDLGVRFVYSGPTYMEGQQGAHFVLDTWDPAQAPLLFPQVCANGAVSCGGSQRRALNPLTGDLLPTTFVGRLVPGSGNPYNGMVVFDQTPWEGVFRAAPRVGIAWDVTGDGKTAVRAGFGTNYDRYGDDTILRMIEQPPIMDTNQANLTTLDDLLSAPLTQTPRSVRGLAQVRPPTVHTWSASVQRELPGRVIGDVAYVGNAGRDLGRTIQLNDLDYGVRFRPESRDPVTGTILQTNFLRPIRGFGGIQLQVWNGEDSFHSIQFSLAQRRTTFSWSAAYTGVLANYSMGSPDPFLTDAENRARNRQNGGRPHNLVINYSYQIPNLSTVWNNVLVRGVFDGWQISGLTDMRGGTRTGFEPDDDEMWDSGTGELDENMTGGSGNSRVNVVCDPSLARSERTFERQFRTECIQPPGGPAAGDPFYLGTSTLDEWVSLGFINHDLTIQKSFALGGRRSLQLRIEAYNAFNTTQYGSVDTQPLFDFTTGEQVNPNFGRVTGARGNSHRVMQVALRFSF